MAIEITEFANVSIAVSPVGVAGGNFGILGFLTKDTDEMAEGATPISPSERHRSYGSLDGVTADWSTNSEVYKAASAFYAATPTPTDFTVLINFTQSTAATLVGNGSNTDISAYQAISAGSISIVIDGTQYDASGTVDLSTATDFEDVAAAVEAALETAGATLTVTHDGSEFTVSGGITFESTVTNASGDVSDLCGLTFGTASNGAEFESATQSLAESVNHGASFVGLVVHKDWRDTQTPDGSGFSGDVVEIATWAEASKKIFCNTTNDANVLKSTSTTDVASAMKGMTLRFTLTTYSGTPSQYPSAAVFGRAASVNFSALASTITLNLKQIPTISAENLTKNQFDILKGKFASAVVQIGTTVNAYTDSRMASGSWLDTTHGLLWLENRCETDMFNLLYQSATKIPYTQSGLNIAASRLGQSLEAAVRNGLAGPGFLPDGTFLPKGYRINAVSLADTASSDKGNRVYNGLSFDMVGAGALHEVNVSGNFSE